MTTLLQAYVARGILTTRRAWLAATVWYVLGGILVWRGAPFPWPTLALLVGGLWCFVALRLAYLQELARREAAA